VSVSERPAPPSTRAIPATRPHRGSSLAPPEAPVRQLPPPIRRDWPTAGGNVLRTLAAAMVPLGLAADVRLVSLLTSGLVAVFGTLPVWLPRFLREAPGGALLAAFGLIAVGSGFVLSWQADGDHLVSTHAAVKAATSLAMYVFGVGALWWSNRIIGLDLVVLLFALVLLAQAVTSPSTWSDNPWKFAFSFPVSLIVLTVTARLRSTLVVLGALGALGLWCVLHDSRSAFAMFVVVGLALLYQRLRRHQPRRPSSALFIPAALAIATTLYYTLTTLILSGALGAGLKLRSEAQLESSGSLLLGGRPEWTVTMRLMRERPWGFGFGVQPSQVDINLGREGFASIHLSSQDNYLYNYVFNQIFRLHSITADLWAAAGFAGIALMLVMVWLLVTALSESLSVRTASAVLLYLCVRSLWDLGFSPIYSALPGVALALAVAVSAKTVARERLAGLDLGAQRPPPRAGRRRSSATATLTGTLPVVGATGPVTGSFPLPATGSLTRPTGSLAGPVTGSLTRPASGAGTRAR